MIDAFEVIGISGSGLLLLAFIMNQLHFWADEYILYDLSNFLGSILLVIYAYSLSSWPFLF